MRRLLVILVMLTLGLVANAQFADTTRHFHSTNAAYAVINNHQLLWGKEYHTQYENAKILHGLSGWMALNGKVGRKRVELWMLKEDPRFDRFGLPLDQYDYKQ